MFGFLKYLIRLPFLLLMVAILVGVYRTDLQQLLKSLAERYVHQSASESVPLQFTEEAVFTSAQLAKYNGEDGAPLYLALLGSVFDVSRGLKHYGTGCSYNFFVGRDASVSFISGEFEHYDPETADDVLSLKPIDLIGLASWRDFYAKDYVYKGKLIGRFYDEQGELTPYHHKFLALLEQAQQAKAEEEELRQRYPGCNIEWSEAKGTRVWCTRTSGNGKERAWSGYPRKLYSRGSKNYQCACVPEEELNVLAAQGDVMFKPYENCEERSEECFYRV